MTITQRKFFTIVLAVWTLVAMSLLMGCERHAASAPSPGGLPVRYSLMRTDPPGYRDGEPKRLIVEAFIARMNGPAAAPPSYVLIELVPDWKCCQRIGDFRIVGTDFIAFVHHIRDGKYDSTPEQPRAPMRRVLDSMEQLARDLGASGEVEVEPWVSRQLK